jgi:crotonobetainyl-CoA:carnitine CoA-transferase CaiB-like acyl-CoA transferase
MTDPTERKGPLTDIRLVELGQLIAGPYCGQLMADMGAPLWWSVCARNKRCVTANLREDEGQKLVKQLIASADMVLENFRPGTMERWGLGYEDLIKINPGIIMIRVSGYGQTGPYSTRAGYASVGEAMGGMRYLCGEPDRPPSRAGLSIGDTLAATFACNGALAALHHREKTGEGQVIDASIFESVLSVMEATIPEYVVSNYIRERSGSTLPNVAPSNVYNCADGTFLIAANQDTVFRRLAAIMGQPELADDARFATHTARGENMAILDDMINEWTGTKMMTEVDALMQEAGVPAGRIYRAPEMLEDPHFQSRDAIIDMPSKEWPDLKMQNIFPKMSKTQGEVRWPGITTLGAHNREVYGGELGLSDGELARLEKNSII